MFIGRPYIHTHTHTHIHLSSLKECVKFPKIYDEIINLKIAFIVDTVNS